MAKYVEGISDIILSQVDIVNEISRHVQLKKSGKNYKGLCPFHSEKTPSFVVSQDRQGYHCFGCGEKGNAISFVMKYEHLDYLDAIEQLADRYAIDLSSYEIKGSQATSSKTSQIFYEMNKSAALFFYKSLKDSTKAQNYFESRGLSKETLKRFGLGYAPDSWDSLNLAMKGSYSNINLENSGLFGKRNSDGQLYDRFRDRVVFPIIDTRKRVVGFGARILGEGQPKYLNSPETPVFNKSNVLYGLNTAKDHTGENASLILVEGYMDVISLAQHGVNNAVATLGTAITHNHVKLVSRYAKEVYIFYDSDQAGIQATIKAIEIFKGSNLRVFVGNLDTYKDPDEFIKAQGLGMFMKKVENAKYYVEFLLDLNADNYDLSKTEQKYEYFESIKPVLNSISSVVERDLYLDMVSERLGIEKDVLRQDLTRIKKEEKRDEPKLDEAKLSKLSRLIYNILLARKFEPHFFNQLDIENIFSKLYNKNLYEFITYVIKNGVEIDDYATENFSLDELELINEAHKEESYIKLESLRNLKYLIIQLLEFQANITIENMKIRKNILFEEALDQEHRKKIEDEFQQKERNIKSSITDIRKELLSRQEGLE